MKSWFTYASYFLGTVSIIALLMVAISTFADTQKSKNSSSNSKPIMNLANTNWNIVSFDNQTIKGQMNFADKTVGTNLCNLMSADYTQDRQLLTLKHGISTLMYCEGVIQVAENTFVRNNIFTIELVNSSEIKLLFGEHYFTLQKQ